jgi:hypothetical protein
MAALIRGISTRAFDVEKQPSGVPAMVLAGYERSYL